VINGQFILAVIPARGGSKDLPNKNLKRLGGLPLVAHTILAAKQAATLDRIILSTDSPEIAKVGKRYGVEVPFLRPAGLATDGAGSCRELGREGPRETGGCCRVPATHVAASAPPAH